MASTNVFDLAAMNAVEGMPLNMPFSSHSWDSSTPQANVGLGNVQQGAQPRLFEHANTPHGLEGAVSPTMLNSVPNSLHPGPQVSGMNANSSNAAQAANVSGVLPMQYGLTGSSSSVGNTHKDSLESIHGTSIHETQLPTPVGENPSFSNNGITLATASALQVPSTSTPGIMNTPGGLRLAFTAPVSDAKTSKIAQVVVQPGAPNESEQYLPKIGGLVEELAEKAADARNLFLGAQYDKCSENLSEVRSRLKAISDIGMESLATAVDYQQHKMPPIHEEGQTSQTATTFEPQMHRSPSLSPEKEKYLYSAALFSGVHSSPGRRKRPKSSDVRELPVKALRGDVTGAQAVLQRTGERSEGHTSTSRDESQSALFSPVPQSPIFDFPTVKPQQGPINLSHGSTVATSQPASFYNEPQMLLGANCSEDPTLTPKATMANLKTDIPNESQPAMLSRSRTNSINAASAPFANSHSENASNELALPTDTLHFGLEQQSWQERKPSFSGGDSNAETQKPLMHSRHSSNSTDDAASAVPGVSVPTGTDSSVDESWESIGQLDKANCNELPPELRKRLDEVFHEFLNSLCSNLDATDDRGEPIHQTLMPKKMARLDESPDFRPFKFRIQAFTNAFQSELQRRGIHEGICSIKKIKQYLWTQPFISRFNEDGKKAKSKGNHIWNIEAKKLPEGGWVFRTFSPKIAGAMSKVAHVNERWTWNLRIWDPQASSSSIKVVYTANTLPSWLHWEDNEKVLTGVPQSTAQSGEVSVTALYVHLGQLHRLEHSFFLKVLPHSDTGTSSAPDSVLGAGTTAPPEPEHSMGADNLHMLPSASVNNQMLNLPLPNRNIPETPFERESIKYEVVEPSRATDMLSSIPFPFTPPVYMDNRVQYLSLDQAGLGQKAENIGPSSAFNLPNNRLYTGQSMSGIAQPSPMNQTAVFVGNAAAKEANTPAPAAGQTLPQNLMTQDPLRATQLCNMIERRQQDQVASLMLSIPSRRPSFSLNEHPGQGTPMSNLPNDMSATLPHIHPHTPTGP